MFVLRAADRIRSIQPGIVSMHCFSAGAHYDPDNLSFGAVIGCDEHLLAPGAGFDDHAHRGVEILSWVLSGTLSHRDSLGVSRELGVGEPMVQSAGGGIRHSERNASDAVELRLIQTTVLADVPFESAALVESAQFDIAWLHLFVAAGQWSVDGIAVGPGDSVRADGRVAVEGRGLALLVYAASRFS
jgi:redox-sensitive bicupin YhaK (pirin superfamily)